MSRGALNLLALLWALTTAGCYASNVVAEQERGVALEAPKLSWKPAGLDDVPGFYTSTEVEGEAAGALLRAYYYLDRDGGYSGAALVVGEGGPQFVVIAEDGHWTLDAAGLDLHDGSGPSQVQVATDHLRLDSGGSAITFQRVELR